MPSSGHTSASTAAAVDALIGSDCSGSPGLDLPALESAEIAKAYGVPAQRVDGRDALHAAMTEALAADGPQLVEVKVAPGMALS